MHKKKTGKKAASFSHLPSFLLPVYPSYIHTAALIFHRHLRNMFILHLEQKNFFFENVVIFGKSKNKIQLQKQKIQTLEEIIK